MTSATGQSTATVKQPYFSFLPHVDTHGPRVRCFCFQASGSPSSITWCAGQEPALRDSVICTYQTPFIIYWSVRLNFSSKWPVWWFKLQTECDSNSGICMVSFLPYLPSSSLRIERGWGIFKEGCSSSPWRPLIYSVWIICFEMLN